MFGYTYIEKRNNTLDVEIVYTKDDFGHFRYVLKHKDNIIMSSIRSFLTKDEATIESEWLMNKLGLVFKQ